MSTKWQIVEIKTENPNPCCHVAFEPTGAVRLIRLARFSVMESGTARYATDIRPAQSQMINGDSGGYETCLPSDVALADGERAHFVNWEVHDNSGHLIFGFFLVLP